MARKLDIVVVVDIEATCSNDGTVDARDSEIIEIGVCMLDVATGERSDIELRPLYVRRETTRIMPFCTEITGITQDMIDRHGIPFAEACQVLQEACKPKQPVVGDRAVPKCGGDSAVRHR